MNTYADKPNPNATIGFAIYYPFQFHIYKNTYFALKEKSEFIIDLYSLINTSEYEPRLRSIIEILDRFGASYRIIFHADYELRGYMTRFFTRYDCLCSVWEAGCLKMPFTKDIKKIRFPYGVGKELTMLRPSGGLYDLTLAIGERDASKFSQFSYTKIVGYSRFDDWFNKTLDFEEIKRISSKLDTQKKTILYLPTHSDLSSVDILADSLKSCAEHYNVIVKIHYAMIHEISRIKKLTDERILLLDDTVDFLSLFYIADVVVSDNSSAIFEAILVDKPILVADFWDEKYLNEAHREVRNIGLTQGVVTFSDSIEQIVKREKKVHLVQTPFELEEKIRVALEDDSYYKDQRRALREELFSYNDGRCTQRYVEAILECISRTEPYPKPAMYHAIDAYTRKDGMLTYGHEVELYEKIAYLSAAVHDPTRKLTLDVIILDEDATPLESRRESLQSLLWQDFPAESLSLSLFSQDEGLIAQNIADNKDRVPPHTVRRIKRTHPLGAALQQYIKNSSADVVVFASTHVVYPSDWLTLLSSGYGTYQNTCGVGGYLRSLETSSFSRYFSRQLSRKLFPSRMEPRTEDLYEVTNDAYDQNPAGELCVMSYKRTMLPYIVESIDDMHLLGLSLKKLVTEKKNITFIPFCGVVKEKLTLPVFIKTNYLEGMYDHLVSKEGRYDNRSSLLFGVFDSILVLSRSPSLGDALTSLLGNVSFSCGFKKVTILKIYSVILKKIIDIKKSLDLNLKQ